MVKFDIVVVGFNGDDVEFGFSEKISIDDSKKHELKYMLISIFGKKYLDSSINFVFAVEDDTILSDKKVHVRLTINKIPGEDSEKREQKYKELANDILNICRSIQDKND